MSEPIASRHALITGAGKRVGAALARDLATAGWSVTIHHRTSEQAAEALARAIRRDGGSARTVHADFARPQEAVAMLEAVEAEGPPVSLLVNSAAAFVYDGVGSLTFENLNAHFVVNAATPILLAQAFHAAKDRRNQQGVVINILDNKIFAPNADYFSYSVSKFALAGATRMLAMALAPLVRVCGIAPSVLLVSGEQTEEDFYRTMAVNPMRRATDLEDICRTVRFLAESESLNGEIITVDRGQTLMNLPRDIAFLDDAVIKSLQWPRP